MFICNCQRIQRSVEMIVLRFDDSHLRFLYEFDGTADFWIYIMNNRDRAKVLWPWLYPYCYRKYIPDNIQGSYLRVMVDSKGIEPSTSAMRTQRSPSWATSPNRPFFNQKSYEKQIFEIFGFEEKSRKTRLVNGKRTSAAGCSFIWLQTQRPPRWTMSPSFLSCNGR